MRVAVAVLLFANLAFFAWSHWIDGPTAAAAAPAARGLAPLVLAAQADAASARSGITAAGSSAGALITQCVSVGPFDSEERSVSAQTTLRERGYQVRERAQEAQKWDGYWVYVAGLESDLDEARVMRTLIQAQLGDARILPLTDEGRRISVGVFSDRDRAERRQRLVKRLGVDAQLGERRSAGTVYWLDVDLKPSEPLVSTDGLLPPQTPGSTLETHPCAAPG